MLAAILQCAGYRVGRYTSPDLVDFRDRICVNGEWISETAFATAVERMVPELFASGDLPSQFEALTAAGFEHFRVRFVDIAVVEVGLGGRFDATNIVAPVLTVLTNVSLDHTALLGSTVAEIAWEKAGIAKPSIPMLIGELHPSAEAVVTAECSAVGAPLRRTAVRVEREASASPASASSYLVEGDDLLPRLVELPLLGVYQLDNLRLALTCVLLLRERGWCIPLDAVAAGLASVRWPGRWEVMREKPTVLLDGAHNVAAASIVAQGMVEWEPDREHRALLLGVLRDKDVAGIVGALAPHFDRIGVVASSSPRALDSDELALYVEKHVERCIRYDSVEEGVRDLVRGADPRDTILVTGSLTVVAEARRALGGT
jgi:dihydrofolate synthase/folylpolyglutamate synthase